MEDYSRLRAGKFVQDVRNAAGLIQGVVSDSPRHLSRIENTGLSRTAHQSTYSRLRTKLGIHKEDLEQAGRGFLTADTFLSHPHHHLLRSIWERVTQNDRIEVVAPPDVLYREIIDHLRVKINYAGRRLVEIDVDALPERALDAVWAECASRLQVPYNDFSAFSRECQRKYQSKEWVLVIRGMDELASEQIHRGQGDLIGQWCGRLHFLNCCAVLFNTFGVKDFERFFEPTSPRPPNRLRFDETVHCDHWDLWLQGELGRAGLEKYALRGDDSVYLRSAELARQSVRISALLSRRLTEDPVSDSSSHRGTKIAHLRQHQQSMVDKVEAMVPKHLLGDFRSATAGHRDNPTQTDFVKLIGECGHQGFWNRTRRLLGSTGSLHGVA